MPTNLEVVPKDPEEFNLEGLCLDQSHIDGVSVKVPITIPCTKPPKQDWVWVHPDDHLEVGAIELKEEREFHLVDASMVSVLGDEVSLYSLRPYINRSGVLRLWPIRLPGADGRQNEWHRSAAVAANYAMKEWVRVVANTSLGAYEVLRLQKSIPGPNWPELSLHEMVKIAFHDRGRIIRDHDHPVVRMLTGRL